MNRPRMTLAVAIILCIPLGLRAGQADDAGEFPKLGKDQIIKLQVNPSEAPDPALKYRLLPELRDMRNGNAAIRYYRAFSPEWLNFNHKDLRKALAKWIENPRKAPPEILNLRGGPLQEIDEGSRRTYCDWDMLRGIRKEGIALLLPDIQSFGIYNQLLAARTRFRTNDGKFAESAYSLQSGFAFARHVGDGPTVIQSLVGIAMSRQTLLEVEEWIRQKDSPNLYWSLTHLPAPFIDLRRPMQGEKIMIDQMFPGWRKMLNDKNARPLTQLELDEKLNRILKLAGSMGLRQDVVTFNRIRFAVLAAREYPAAQKFLLKQGRPPSLVEKMPVTQAVLLYEVYQYDRRFDDMLKWYGLPAVQARRGIREFDKQLQQDARSGADGFLAQLLAPAATRIFDASYGLDRRIAGLRCVEAIRLYAAAHGKLPKKLSDIEEVPVPDDPFTGEAFPYQVKGSVAYLYTAALKGHGPVSASGGAEGWRYELMLKK